MNSKTICTWKLWITLAVAALFLSPVSAEVQPPAEADHAEYLGRYANLLNDLSERRRRLVYTPYQTSPFTGLNHGYVQTTTGSSSFSRVDMVVDAGIPIVVRRVYTSSNGHPGDFGVYGWQLSILESITPDEKDGYVYHMAAGNDLRLDKKGTIQDLAVRATTDVLNIKTSNGRFKVETRSGFRKSFEQLGHKYLLKSVNDDFGNRLTMDYGDDGRVSTITSSSGMTKASVTFRRDSAGRIISIADLAGREITYSYNDLGELEGVYDLRGEKWSYEYSNGKLVEALAPDGNEDLQFSYEADGRAQYSKVNGSEFVFEYDGLLTRVRENNTRVTEYLASERGLAVQVTSPLGITTSIDLDTEGRPVGLRRDSVLHAQATYRGKDAVYPSRIEQLGKQSKTKRVGTFDSAGRVIALSSNDRIEYRVDGYSHGLVPRKVQTNDHGNFRFRFDKHGNLSRYASDSGPSYLLTNKQNELQIALVDSSKIATIQFDRAGDIESVVAPNGEEYWYGVDSAGFRNSSLSSDNTSLKYEYDSSGSLRYSSIESSAHPTREYEFSLIDSRMLDQIASSDGEVHNFSYYPSGEVESINSDQIGDYWFEYDQIGRLVSVTDEKGQAFVHEYSEGEPDIIRRFDSRTSPEFNQRFSSSDFAGRYEMRYARPVATYAGVIGFDADLGEFTLPYFNPDWSPATPISTMFESLRLSALFEDTGPNFLKFSMPSNRFFVPEEIWSVNCCPCWEIAEIDENDNEGTVSFCFGCFPEPEEDPPMPPGTIILEYVMFIPTNHVRFPGSPVSEFDIGMYGGDDKTFHLPFQSFRIKQTLLIDTVGKILLPIKESGVTKGWSDPSSNLVNGSCVGSTCTTCKYPTISFWSDEPYVYLGQCRANATPQCELQASDMSTIEASIAGVTTTSMTVEFSGDPDNACEGSFFDIINYSADISWINSVTIDWSGRTPVAIFDLDHDGFPSHQINLNGFPVYQFSPILNGKSPWSLAFPKDISGSFTVPIAVSL